MITHFDDRVPGDVPLVQRSPIVGRKSYSTELSCDLLDEQGAVLDCLINFAFDTLGVHILDVRVIPADHRHPRPQARARSIRSNTKG
jgi:hypothetical protein